MSPTHRYQSRLFQTVRSQVNHLKDNVQLRWRQIKVAATWGAQAALLPLYTLFQAGRWGAQVLRQTTATAKQTLLSFVSETEIPTADQPIKNVLDAIECAALPYGALSTLGNAVPNAPALFIRPIAKPKSALAVLRKKLQTFLQPWRVSTKQPNTLSDLSISASVSLQPTQQNSIVSRSIAIRGIASSLTHQRLVLVTSDNQLLDVLTPDQQRQLHQRIIWEIAQVCYLRRQFDRTHAIPAWKTWTALPIQVKTQYSLPVRAIYHLMAWVQHQPIAQTALLLPKSRPTLAQQPVFTSLHQWCLNLFPSSSSFPPLYKGGLRGVVQGITHFAQPLQPLLLSQNVQKVPLALIGQKPTLPILSTLAQKLRGCRTVLVAVAGAIALLPFTLALPEPASAAMVPTMPAPLPSPLMVERLIDPARSRRRWQAEEKLSEQSGRLSAGKVRIATQKTAAALSAQKFEGAIADWAGRFSQATAARDSSTIEVKAVFMGYDHHPLEALLLWVDRAIAWIEAQFTKISNRLLPKLQVWIRQYWHRA